MKFCAISSTAFQLSNCSFPFSAREDALDGELGFSSDSAAFIPEISIVVAEMSERIGLSASEATV